MNEWPPPNVWDAYTDLRIQADPTRPWMTWADVDQERFEQMYSAALRRP